MALPVPVDIFYCGHASSVSLTETDFLRDTCVEGHPEYIYIPCHQEEQKSRDWFSECKT